MGERVEIRRYLRNRRHTELMGSLTMGEANHGPGRQRSFRKLFRRTIYFQTQTPSNGPHQPHCALQDSETQKISASRHYGVSSIGFITDDYGTSHLVRIETLIVSEIESSK